MRNANWAALAFFLLACGEKAPEPLPEMSGKAPPDDLAKASDLVEGSLDAFGLKLPKDAVVQQRTPNSITVELGEPLEKVSTYLRGRLVSDSIEVGPRRTIFHDAKLKEGSAESTYEVVVRKNNTSSIVHVVKNLTAAPEGRPRRRSREEDEPSSSASGSPIDAAP